jgi:BTB/POZ domain-containing protein KCTD9
MAQYSRRSIEETWRALEARGRRMPHDDSGRPFIPPRRPHPHDNEPLGFRFFRTWEEDADFSNFTLMRTFFGRSLFERVDFSGTDLSEGWMCWNDFTDCDFSGADLSGSDMRSSIFARCRFNGAKLLGADLRRSTFEDCDFTNADLTGATADYPHADAYELSERLSDEQWAVMKWDEVPGPEPDGG